MNNDMKFYAKRVSMTNGFPAGDPRIWPPGELCVLASAYDALGAKAGAVDTKRALFLLGLLGEVAGTAFRAADDSEERDEEGSRVHIVGSGDFDALSRALDACDELPELDDCYVRDGWLRALDELRGLLAAPVTPWTALADEKPDDGIRVIGATDDFIVGDLYHGRAGLVSGRMGEEGYVQAQKVVCWRYSQGGNPVEAHLIPTYWQPLPPTPKPKKPFNPLVFSDSPDGAAAEAVYLRQVAAEDKFNGR